MFFDACTAHMDHFVCLCVWCLSVCLVVTLSVVGCSRVILLSPKIGVEPPKHDVISMPTQQYTNTNYISLEKFHLVVSIMLRHIDRIKIFNDNLSCGEVKIDKKILGDLPYFVVKCDKFL